MGKNILENLTTGMYKDSKVAYREYIQNACDQIKKAEATGILNEGEGCVTIFIDPSTRYVSIEDNATGVEETKFESQLGDIANSEKEQGKDLGFRGIGRLCGLAYCKKLIFTTSFKGESSKSIMEIDAAKMRDLISSKERYEADFVMNEVTVFSREVEESEKHYFKVELLDINKENTELLNIDDVRNYLSFVAPVPFKNTFIFRNKIYEHANSIGQAIAEYDVRVCGKQVFKEYHTRLYEGSNTAKRAYDEIFKIEFKEFYTDDKRLIAWMWYGLCKFEKSIPKGLNQMWGLRLRQGNIEIGGNDVLRPFFKEERGNGYFVGEVYAVSTDLIPNSQRDYFNENPMRVEFEDRMRRYFYEVLHKIYRDANEVKVTYRKIEEYHKAVERYNEQKRVGFTDDEEEHTLAEQVKKAKEKKKDAERKIGKIYSGNNRSELDKSPIDHVLFAIREGYEEKTSVRNKNEEKSGHEKDEAELPKQKYFTDGLAKLSRKERKLVSQIMAIVIKHASEEAVQEIRNEITEEFT